MFIDAVFNNEQIPIHGDGRQTRSFTYVSDTVAGLHAALTLASADGELINIGSTFEISILDLAKLIKRLSGTPGELNYQLVPYASFTGNRYEDVRRRVPDVSRCQRLLGVSAKVSIEDGLRATIAWQKDAVRDQPALDPGAICAATAR